jgi:lipoate-protein ligase A
MTGREPEWRVDRRTGDAAALHADWPEAAARPADRAVGVCRVTHPCLVLGSTQSEAVVDTGRAAARGIGVARRRSGGGAVLVTPADPVWVDVWLPAGDPLWHPDVGRSFEWLGNLWVAALTGAGVAGLSAHRGRPGAGSTWSSLVCFGAVGSGEVVTDDGRKVVGLAQRRSREGAWFHGACVLRWDPAPLVDLLALSAADRAAAVRSLRRSAAGVADLGDGAGGMVTRQGVVDALLAAFP